MVLGNISHIAAESRLVYAPRVVIDRLTPDLGRFSAKVSEGEAFAVEAVILCDGHEILKADLLYRHNSEKKWRRVPFVRTVNDTYRAVFKADRLGTWLYTAEAAIDRFAGWKDAYKKKNAAGEADAADAQTGLGLIDAWLSSRGNNANFAQLRGRLLAAAEECRDNAGGDAFRTLLDDAGLEEQLRGFEDDPSVARFPRVLSVAVDPSYAVFSSWYEFFPRSRWKNDEKRGTLKGAAARLDYIADMGFDVVYLPPIHPIGVTNRKGRNNSLRSAPGDAGSPWAIGSADGGHKAVHPELGTLKDFDAFVAKAQARGMKVALDIAFQCSPDHPYVKEHPEWFKRRPDGSLQYAENPPKKYEDIYPFDFECLAWRELWQELKSVIVFWLERGVRVLRVDNPHTKSFAFWDWALHEIRAEYPDAVFLAEAFTRPDVMAYLAKIGFNQSYTYFTWRHNKYEITQYLNELTHGDLKDYFRPNFWPNTPDILPDDLQKGSRAAFIQRLVLAATLSASYGIYGPPFELMEHEPAPGREEYNNSEKYEIRAWDVAQPQNLSGLIRKLNDVRRRNACLQANHRLEFHPVTNESIIAYTKQSAETGNTVLTVVNLAPEKQAGVVDLQLHLLGISPEERFTLRDMLTGATYDWRGWKNYVELDPAALPAHIFRIERHGAQA